MPKNNVLKPLPTTQKDWLLAIKKKELKYASYCHLWEKDEDIDFVIEIVKSSTLHLNRVPSSIRKKVAFKMLEQKLLSPQIIEKLDWDEEIFFKALTISGNAFKYITVRFQQEIYQQNQDVYNNLCLVAIQNGGFSVLKYIHFQSPELVLKALEFGPSLEIISDKKRLDYIWPTFWQDKNFSSAAISKDGLLLEASIEKSSTQVKLALQQNALALQFAPEEFQNNREIVFFAVKQNPFALNYASKVLKSDANFIKTLLCAVANRPSYAILYCFRDSDCPNYFGPKYYNSYIWILTNVDPRLPNQSRGLLHYIDANGNCLKFYRNMESMLVNIIGDNARLSNSSVKAGLPLLISQQQEEQLTKNLEYRLQGTKYTYDPKTIIINAMDDSLKNDLTIQSLKCLSKSQIQLQHQLWNFLDLPKQSTEQNLPKLANCHFTFLPHKRLASETDLTNPLLKLIK